MEKTQWEGGKNGPVLPEDVMKTASSKEVREPRVSCGPLTLETIEKTFAELAEARQAFADIYLSRGNVQSTINQKKAHLILSKKIDGKNEKERDAQIYSMLKPEMEELELVESRAIMVETRLKIAKDTVRALELIAELYKLEHLD